MNDSIVLTNDQQAVYDMVVNNDLSVAITGLAKSGKTELLRAIIVALQPKYLPGELVIVAGTWAAVGNLHPEGIAIQGFAGFNDPGPEKTAGMIVDKMTHFKKKRLSEVKVLVIDDVSLLGGAYFDKFDTVMQRIKGRFAPFGGIQLVAAGDFFGLPSIFDPTDYTFEAKAWGRAFEKQCKLEGMGHEGPLADLLECWPRGFFDERTLTALSQLASSSVYASEPESFTLVVSDEDAAATANKKFQDALPENDIEVYRATDSSGSPNKQAPMDQDMQDSLELKVDMLVEVIKDHTTREGTKLNRGDVGKVTGFGLADRSGERAPIVAFREPTVLKRVGFKVWFVNTDGFATPKLRNQIPLIPAFAKAVHKVAGGELFRTHVNAQAFENEPGLFYAAISRSLNSEDGNLVITSWEPEEMIEKLEQLNTKMDQKAVAYFRSVQRASLVFPGM